ncbi:UDP-3-O-[3-hydroxymyristoyl] glucosamine N-acyltransferase [Litorimonas taeanensis]|uniref:UDP-3-O-acylglucosamine N-acyltransferase n=1 Tax=Litorimonas taeanensis TaxID=568099 RepID=A0A420WL38_9PROT|nr:UDP-3-O-(3-hydroxymyristoyl)glucosamine N-acyltransferase [Litorimonas taeanensis]RKQ71626.1 UDP-3-O-[3-hydroxymyristoyl] glucosamine N-acyltransferase [Litorimonas taeanensis]
MIDPRFYTLNEPMSLSALIQGLNVDLDPHFYDVIINRPNTLAEAISGDIVFLENKRLVGQIDCSKATACIVTKSLAPKVSQQGILPIISHTPRAHFARLCETLVLQTSFNAQSDISEETEIHPSAIIGAGAKIGKGTKIGPYTVIGDGVEIGAGTVIGAHVSLSFCIVGQNCRIKPNAVIGGAGFGVAKDEQGYVDLPHLGRVIIGDRVSIGSQSCIDRGQLGDTILGDDVKIDNLVQIAHNVRIGKGTMMAGRVGISGSCVIGDNVQMGGSVGLADHIKVGDGARIAAGSGVMNDIPKGEVWGGMPALPMREYMRMVSATRKMGKRPERNSK